MTQERRDLARRHVSRSIRMRVRIYALIFLVMTVVVVVDTIVIGPRSILPALACVAGGIVVGLVASRMLSLSWDAVSGTVVGRLDVIGGIVLVGYLAFSIFRGDLLDLWYDGPVLAVAGLAALAGAMAGQVLGTSRGVGAVLRIVAGDAQRNPPADHQS